LVSIRKSANLWSVSRLPKVAAERLLAFLGDARAVDGPAPFTAELVDRLADACQSEFATYWEIDVGAREQVANQMDCSYVRRYVNASYPDDEESRPARIATLADRVEQSPDGVGTWSATVARETRWRLETTPWARSYEVVDCAFTLTPITGSERAAIILHRQGRDFTAADRRALSALRPHVAAIARDARARRRLADFTAATDAAGDEPSRGFTLLDTRLRIDHASPAARRILAAWFDGPPTRLPSLVVDWLRSDARREPLRLERGGKRLVVEAPTNGALVISEESTTPATLTPREREVLQWIAAGKSTDEIARELCVTAATVSKHLEHIYRKLGVTSRTGALAALGARSAPRE
jgi:DNA-binding CsgD family transcriptional regulator